MLKGIIEATTKTPTIVNAFSNFVVVTYWWGRGNKNSNTARPCIDYYESISSPLISLALASLKTASKNQASFVNTSKNLHVIVSKLDAYKKHIKRRSKAYMGMLESYCNIPIHSTNKEAELIITLETYKKMGKTPIDYEYKTVDEIEGILDFYMNQFLLLNNTKIVELFKIQEQTNRLKSQYMKNHTTYDERRKVLLKNIIKKNTDDKNGVLAGIKQNLKAAIYRDGQNILDKLNFELRYLTPIPFEDMITKWENECRENDCNFLAV